MGLVNSMQSNGRQAKYAFLSSVVIIYMRLRYVTIITSILRI